MDSLGALMHDSLTFVARRYLAQVISLLLHEVLGVQIQLLVVLANILQLLLFVLELLLLLHLLECYLLVVELPQIVLLLLKKDTRVPVLGHLLLAIIKCQQVPHAHLVLPGRASDSLALHLRLEVERALEAAASLSK